MPRKVPEMMDPEIGLVRWCNRCQDWWPKDDEFWFFSNGYVVGNCKACCAELRRERNAAA